MRYALLIHILPESYDTLDDDAREALTGEYLALRDDRGSSAASTSGPSTRRRPCACRTAARSSRTVRSRTRRRSSAGSTSSRPTTSTRRSRWPSASLRCGWAGRWRSARSWRCGTDRAGRPRRVGPRPGVAHRLPRRPRPRRGGRAGGIPRSGGALAAGRRAVPPGGVARDDRAQPGRGPHPARADARREDPAARRARARGGRRVRADDDPRRAPGADLRLLSPRPLDRGAGGAHAARARRTTCCRSGSRRSSRSSTSSSTRGTRTRPRARIWPMRRSGSGRCSRP